MGEDHFGVEYGKEGQQAHRFATGVADAVDDVREAIARVSADDVIDVADVQADLQRGLGALVDHSSYPSSAVI